MIVMIPMLILSLEMVFTFLLTGSLYPVVAVVSLFWGLLLWRMGRSWILRTCSVLLSALFVWALTRYTGKMGVGFILMTVAQFLQVLCYAFAFVGGGEFRKSSGTVASASGNLFVLLGLIPVYFAYSGHIAGVPFVAETIGTILLVLLALEIDRPRLSVAVNQRRTFTAVSWIRFGVLLLVVFVSLMVAGTSAPALCRASRWGKAWLQSIGLHGTGWLADEAAEDGESYQNGSTERGGSLPTRALDLLRQYDLRRPHAAEFHMTVPDPKEDQRLRGRHVYMKTGAFDLYKNMRWTTKHRERRVVEDAHDGRVDGRVTLGSRPTGSVTCHVYTRYLAGGRMPLIPRVNSIALPVVVYHENAVLASPVVRNLARYSYVFTSTPTTWQDIQRHAPKVGDTDSVYTELADARMGRVAHELADQIVPRHADRDEALHRILTHLKTQFQYSLTTTNPGNLDPIENFLLQEKQGHCVLFASSCVLLLRAAGVPARLGVGYCGGEYDMRRRVYTFYLDDAHAWTEVYFKQHGWVIVDPTPPSSGLPPREPEMVFRKSGVDLGQFPDLDKVISETDVTNLATGVHRRKGLFARIRAAVPPVLLVNGLLVLATIIAIVIVNSRVTGHVRHGRHQRRSRPVPSFFRDFCAHFGRAGCRLRRGQTAREYLDELKRRGLVGDECDDVVEYLYSISYEDGDRLPSFEKDVERRLKEWAVSRQQAHRA